MKLQPKPASLTKTAKEQSYRRAKRKNRYEEVLKLHEQGVPQVTIAKLVGLHRDTIRRYVSAPAFPKIVRTGRASRLDPYKAYLHQRMAEGAHNVTHLIAELRERGYRGSDTIVFDYLRPLRQHSGWQQTCRPELERIARGIESTPLSARMAAWLFVCNPRKLKLRQARQLDPLRRFEEELEQAYQLTQDFRAMITLRQGDWLGRWLKEAKSSKIPELCSLVAGIYRDYDAVHNALTLPWSQGQTEAQVHRLKLIKRQAYVEPVLVSFACGCFMDRGWPTGRIENMRLIINAYEPNTHRTLQWIGQRR